ncbi:SusC/RagA family TonB-linked outer membrane protein [Parafilimonas sp.]|uniref:SusC/RagA family TonB-linked outer membrane protein n=1 Tax=Parafilimonas sp. TaxID=1969739 RepID=UPI0039E2EC0E
MRKYHPPQLFGLLFVLLFLSMKGFAQTRPLTGTVKDSANQPLAAATIKVKDGKATTTTAADGSFKIAVPAGNVTLEVTYIGYNPVEVPVGAEQTNVSVIMQGGSNTMGEVVVTALGIKKQARSLGYAVATVGAKDLTESGATNFASALYGKAAGVKVTTAPGGASSAVNITVRGISSINLNTQPLYIVDGVPIRLYNNLEGNLGSNANNDGYWSNSRISGNGVLDINPEDIASITVLKGASASALYGSEATNGVIVITTKSGKKGKGLGVDFNYVINQEKVAYGPDYQNEYGPGYSTYTNVSNGITDDADGWITDTDGSVHPYYRSYQEFGPKFDGRDVKYWDGTTRKYVAQKDNYLDFFQTGYNSNANVAISNASDKGSYRFSYTRMDYRSIMPGSNLNKNNFNLNATLKLSDKVSVDIISTYNINFTHNRTKMLNQLFASYAGFFSRMDDMDTYKRLYKTSQGYKYVGYTTSPQYAEDETFTYNIRATNLLDYFWSAYSQSYNETQNRFINSATLNVAFTDKLKFRGRLGGDFTSLSTVEEDRNTEPVSVGKTGYYGISNNIYAIKYGDVLLTYNNKIAKDLDFTLSAGGTGRVQKYRYQTSGTSGGLVTENWFSLNNSANTVTTSATRSEQLDVAAFGIFDLNYKNLLYLSATSRYEATSTLPEKNNSYFYPSFSAGFILSDAVKLPDLFNYAKLRASYSMVGNHPNIYQANVAYTQSSITYNDGNVLYQYMGGSDFGNDEIRSEKKREAEFGIETKMLNNRLGIDFSYYNNKVSDQILSVTTPSSTGATDYLANYGDLTNYGFEAAFSYDAIRNKAFTWTTRFNFAINKNKLTSLPNGLTSLVNSSQDGGYLIIRSAVGAALGNIYTHPVATDDDGNAIIDDYGYYTIDADSYKYVGNIMPKVVGGLSNSFTYKNFGLDFTLDYRIGGDLVSIPTYYQIGAGMYESTLKYRDAAHGGIAYNVIDDATGDYEASSSGTRHDGVILKGVTSDGETNSKVILAADYYINTYNWETAGLYERAVFKNSYIKFREVTLSYNLPKKLVDKIHFQNIQFAVIGRNLFYLWKTLPYGIDPEAAVGSSWLSQGFDIGAAAPTRSLGVSLRASF